jgi:HlyD family secretion protein
MPAEVVLDATPEKRFRGRVLRLGQVFGAARSSGDPSEPADVRVIECVVALDDQSLRIGQRVLVRVLP